MKISRIDDEDYTELMSNVIRDTRGDVGILYNMKHIEFDVSTGFIRHEDGYLLVPRSIDMILSEK